MSTVTTPIANNSDKTPSNVNAARVYTVSELNASVKNLLEKNIASLWVSGEISNLAQPSSGHMYFSLKDATAQVRCAMFRNQNNQAELKIKNGMQVVAQARVSLYELRGDYQLIVHNLQAAGVGVLQQKFLALKERLQKEGLFASEHKKPLPKLPRCIGVITSPTGAAIRDVLSVLKRRCALVPVIIYPTAVQGDEAAKQIVRAIATANARRECDVLIITRGGGSIEDLWPFNEEIVARAIFSSSIPTISAVGHEIDFTIADFVADLRAPTPSAAAELIVPNMLEKIETIKTYQRRLLCFMQSKIQHLKALFSANANRLQHPQRKLQQQQQHVDELGERLKFVWQNLLQRWHHRIDKAYGTLNALSPLATLQRGYAIVKQGNDIVKDASSMHPGNKVDVFLAKGALECDVTSVRKS